VVSLDIRYSSRRILSKQAKETPYPRNASGNLRKAILPFYCLALNFSFWVLNNETKPARFTRQDMPNFIKVNLEKNQYIALKPLRSVSISWF
jgi:hypothetical protein